MNAKESGNARAGALGRGLDTLMGEDEERADQTAQQQEQDPQRRRRDEEPSSATGEDRTLARHAGLVGGLIAGGAAGAVAVAAFSLLGVKAVLSMGRR